MTKLTRFAGTLSVAAAFALAGGAAGCDRGAGDAEEGAPAEQAAPAAEGDESAGDVADPVEGDHELADDLEPGATGHYGAAFTDAEADPIALADAIDSCVDTGETCKVRGEVKKVCKRRGCWMTLEAPAGVDRIVRVRMLDYGFFVPRNIDGAEAIIEGTLEDTETEEARARHYAQDEVKGTDQEPREVEGPEPTYKIVAHGIEVRMPEG